MTGRRTLRRQSLMNEAAFVLVAGRVAGLGPMPDPQAKAAVDAGIGGDGS